MLAGTVTSTDREAAGGAVTDDAMRKFCSVGGPVTGRCVSSLQAARISKGQSNPRADSRFDEICCSIFILGSFGRIVFRRNKHAA